MCTACGDSLHIAGLKEPGRRTLLFGGASLMAAAPVLLTSGSASAETQTQTAEAAVGSGPYPTRAFAVTDASGAFSSTMIQRRPLGPNDVLLETLYASICHSDIHSARGDWGEPKLPCVPGHEIVGRVTAVGSAVTKFRVGDIGGVGCMVDSCGTCDNCLANREQICTNGTTFTYGSDDRISGGHTLGGYSDRIVVSERFVIRIPPGMHLASTAPILCAGITTFSPIRHWDVRPGQRVGVVGLGGLGHMAVKLAVEQRAEVTVFTTTPGKVEDAARLGAKQAVLWNDTEAMSGLANSFDLIVSTVPYAFEVQPFMNMLKLDATLVNVGLGEARGVSPHAMAFGRKSLAGSMIGGIAETQAVVDFCFARNIRPDVEIIQPDQIAAAYDRVVDKDVRYRFVIDFTSAG